MYLRHIRFKIETVNTVRQTILHKDWSVSLDLSDAFFHVPVHNRDRMWLRFIWRGNVYQFNVLPFGLTRMVKDLVRWARERGVRMASYMDDWHGARILAFKPSG